MPAAEKSKEELARLQRCSPGYRAAVLGERELPATRTRGGAVQFAAYGVSERIEGGHTIIRASIDEGKVIELRLPEGTGVYFTTMKPKRGPKPSQAGQAHSTGSGQGGAA